MTNPNESLEAHFEAASALASPEQQVEYLDRMCPDPVLRREVESLLAAHQSPDLIFVQRPARQPPSGLEGVGTRVGHYQLLQQIGEGGCGVVYLAEQTEPVRRQVALKIIKLGMDTRSVIARFEAERQTLALMDHPNIAKVLDAGATASGRPFFVMELVRGVRITDYCDQHRLATRERLDLFLKVCQAVQHAHQKGIIHRDLKPSNILVTVNDDPAASGVPKVIDFGIAKATTHQRLTDKTVFTELEQFLGTPAYMSPEQAEMSGIDIDTRSDIYSLGVLLYELLTGRTPFDGDELLASGVDAMRRTILEREPVPPSVRLKQTAIETNPTARVPRPAAFAADLDWIVMKALEKDRTRRYATANGLAADLKRHLNNEPVVARPPSASYRFQKAWRRNRLAFGAATLVAIALILGLAVSSWHMLAAKRARNAEFEQTLEAQAARRIADAETRKALESQLQARRLLYASDMNLAQQALNGSNLGKARRLLDRHRPQAGEQDLRGWEWRYLWQLTRSSAIATLTNRAPSGNSVAFSHDGTRLAVGWNGGRIDLWDVPSRRWLKAFTEGEYRQLHGKVAFSPVRNLLAATADKDSVMLYDLDTGAESTIWRSPEPTRWDIRDVDFSPDGSRLVLYVGSYVSIGDAVWVMDLSSSKVVRRIPLPASLSALHGTARLSRDNRRLYLGKSDPSKERYSLQCIDVGTGDEVWHTGFERDFGLTALALSPDGKVLASGSGFNDSTIRIWDAATGAPIRRLEGHNGWVCKVAFTGDGQRLFSAASDQSIRIWETVDWTPTGVLQGHSDEVYAVAVSEAAQLAVSASKAGELMLWKEDGKSGPNGYHRLPGDFGLDEVAFVNRSRVLVTQPGKRPEWALLDSDSPVEPPPEFAASTNALVLFGTNTFCQWNGIDRIIVREWRDGGSRELGSVSLKPGIPLLEFAYNPARQMVAWTEGSSGSSVFLERLGTPGKRVELKSDMPWLSFLHFSDDGRTFVATVRSDHSLRAWNTETAELVASLNEHVRAVTFAGVDGAQVLVAAIERGTDHDVGFFDLSRPGQAPRRIPGKDRCMSLAASPDGHWVASTSGGGEVGLFDAVRRELVEFIHGHLNGTHCVAFSPDNRRLVSTSTGREAVKLWDVVTRLELLTLKGEGSGLASATWSADGNMILAGSPWQAWRAPSWEEIATAEAREHGD